MASTPTSSGDNTAIEQDSDKSWVIAGRANQIGTSEMEGNQDPAHQCLNLIFFSSIDSLSTRE